MGKLEKIIIVGARMDGQAGVVLDIINTFKMFKVIGFLDNTPELQGKTVQGLPILGSSDDIDTLQLETNLFHIGIGDNVARGNIFQQLINNGYKVVSIIHPSAIISSNCSIGQGCFIGPRAIINNGTIIHEAVIINTGAIVEHDNSIGFSVHIAPGTITAGRVVVNRFAFIGIGAVLLPDIQIGENAMVGAGSVVVKNVDSQTTVVGYAAQKYKKKNIYLST
jgi:sugar O-acyltransferase (sialic acid O-acetyltransferase NeuD family)